jgi:hypothetical protein
LFLSLASSCVFGVFSVPEAARRDGSFLPSSIDTTPAALSAYITTRPSQMRFVRFNRIRAASMASASEDELGEGSPDGTAAMRKAMRALIAGAYASRSDGIERADIRARAQEAAAVVAAWPLARRAVDSAVAAERDRTDEEQVAARAAAGEEVAAADMAHARERFGDIE